MEDTITSAVRMCIEIVVAATLILTIFSFTYVARGAYEMTNERNAIVDNMEQYSTLYKLDYEKTHTEYSGYDVIDTVLNNSRIYSYKIILKDRDPIILRAPFMRVIVEGVETDADQWKYLNSLMDSSSCIIAGKGNGNSSYLDNIPGSSDPIDWGTQYTIWTQSYLSELLDTSISNKFKCRLVPLLPQSVRDNTSNDIDTADWGEEGIHWESTGIGYIVFEEI